MIITANNNSSLIGTATEDNAKRDSRLSIFQNMRKDLREDLKGIKDIQW